MKYKIITDTSCDLNSELKNKIKNVLVPFSVSIDNNTFKDDEKNQYELITMMQATNQPARTACPSPEDFMQKFNGDEDEKVFVVTISSKLSGTYNSAILAKDIYLEDHPNKDIYVIDSLSASAAETLITNYIHDLLKSNKFTAEEVYKKALEKVQNSKTIFVLQDISNLLKNGRLSKVAGAVVTMLNLKLVLNANQFGEIELFKKARGNKKAFSMLVDSIEESISKVEEKILVISHCNAIDYAEGIKKMLEERINFKKIHIVETNGLSTIYANNGGIVIAY